SPASTPSAGKGWAVQAEAAAPAGCACRLRRIALDPSAGSKAGQRPEWRHSSRASSIMFRRSIGGARMPRVIGIFLDGYDVGLERQMRAAGELPSLAALAAGSARFVLDHGLARNTGLAGEHVASGLSPEDCKRYA